MIEPHIIALEYAKRLHELGLKKESIFYWAEYEHESGDISVDLEMCGYLTGSSKHYPAYTASELMDLIPLSPIAVYRNSENGDYRISNVDIFNEPHLIDFFSDSKIQNALAKMLICLIENNLVEVK